MAGFLIKTSINCFRMQPARAAVSSCAHLFVGKSVQPLLQPLQMPFQLSCLRGVKTKSAAKKRFIRTGSGHLKHGHPGKRHLTGKKSRSVTMKLNEKVLVTGRMKKNMDRLIR